jgi:hypothetical protein
VASQPFSYLYGNQKAKYYALIEVKSLLFNTVGKSISHVTFRVKTGNLKLVGSLIKLCKEKTRSISKSNNGSYVLTYDVMW